MTCLPSTKAGLPLVQPSKPQHPISCQLVLSDLMRLVDLPPSFNAPGALFGQSPMQSWEFVGILARTAVLGTPDTYIPEG